jgi:CheY-like chemotaxis protein
MQKLQKNPYHMVITDMKMETDSAGYDVIRTARQQDYDPATAILTAYPMLGSDWRSEGVHSLLVKPVGTEDLLRQIEALLVTHEDQKQRQGPAPARAASANGRSARNGVRKVS